MSTKPRHTFSYGDYILLGIAIVCLFATVYVIVFQPFAHAKLTKDQATAQHKANQDAFKQAKEARAKQVEKKQFESSKYKVIALELSKACLLAVRAHIITDCPSYEAMATLDETDQKYFGKFVHNPYFHRTKPIINNPAILYKDVTDYHICVDCPKTTLTGSKIITFVTLKDFKWKSNTDSHVVNNTTYQYHNLKITNCDSVLMVYNRTLLDDVIRHLKSDCSTQLDFNPQIKIVKPFSKLTYDGAEYKYQKWLKQAKVAAQKLAREKCLKSEKCR